MEAIYRLGQAAVVSANGCPARLPCWGSLTSFRVSSTRVVRRANDFAHSAKFDTFVVSHS